MPLFDFECSCGIAQEAIRPSGTESVDCPCGRPARRVIARRFGIVGPTTDLRGMFRRFQESTAEIDHTYSKAEANLERPLEAPKLWAASKQRADAMTAAGEAPTFKAP